MKDSSHEQVDCVDLAVASSAFPNDFVKCLRGTLTVQLHVSFKFKQMNGGAIGACGRTS